MEIRLEKIKLVGGILLIIVSYNMFVCQIAHADVSWTLKKQLNLEAAPLDISTSEDGQMAFVLTPGEVLVYSMPDNRVTDRFKVDVSFDKLSIAKGNNLILTSSSGKKLSIFQIEFSQKIDISGVPFKGPDNAPVTIVVFSDYQCPFCAGVEPLVQQVQDKYPKEVKAVMKNYPLSFHKYARNAAVAALASRAQGKYWEFHNKLFENSKALNDEKIQEIAKELGLDIERFNKDRIDPAIQKQIDKDFADGQQAGVRGTPTIFINGKLLKNRSFEGFQQMIEAELKMSK